MLRYDNLKVGDKRGMNKRGISVMIGYILLVSIGLGLSAMVFSWLIHYVPTAETFECPDGLSLSIRNVKCDSVNRVLNFSVKNTGLFTVDGFSIKVNDKPSSSIGVFEVGFNLTEVVPGNQLDYSYNYFNLVTTTALSSDLTLLELQPFIDNPEGGRFNCQPTVKEVLRCGSFEEEVGVNTTIYLTATLTTGGMGGRAGADALCVANKPSGLSCANIHAFLSVNESDEIRDMDGEYGYDSDAPIYWWNDTNDKYVKFADRWTDMLDDTISVSQGDGTGDLTNPYSGSYYDGSINLDKGNCDNFTSSVFEVTSASGRSGEVNGDWLDDITSPCSLDKEIRCIAECSSN